MSITRFTLHLIVNKTLTATVSGETDMVKRFIPAMADLIADMEGRTVTTCQVQHSVVGVIDNAVAQSDIRRVVIPVGYEMELVITPMCSFIGGAV